MFRRAIVLVSLLGLSLSSQLISLAQAPAPAERDFQSLRTLAERQSRDPDVAAYRSRIAGDIDAVLGQVMMHCIRRELYSRRAESDIVIRVEGDGVVSDAILKTENRMGRCTGLSLQGVQLPPPPTAPLYIFIGAKPPAR